MYYIMNEFFLLMWLVFLTGEPNLYFFFLLKKINIKFIKKTRV